MAKYVVRLVLLCGLYLLASCASSPEPTPEKETQPTREAPEREEPEPPEYHAQSDAERLGRDASRQLARPVCGPSPEVRPCRKRVGRGALVYRGSFSGADADEMLVALDDGAVLLSENQGSWSAKSRLEGVDIESCQIAEDDSGANALLCRVPAARDAGYGVELRAVVVTEDGDLAAKPLEVPRATDVDAVLFAGWKDGTNGLEVRLHDASEVRSSRQTIDMDGGSGCRHKTYEFEPAAGLRELESCTTAATADQGIHTDTAYESRLSDPLMKRNRQYVRCYREELARLKEEAERRQELTEQCKAGTADEEVDCSKYVESPEDAESKDGEPTRDSENGEAESAEAESTEAEKPGELAGQIQTRIVIGSPGAPVACRVVGSTMQNERVESCLCRELMKTEFPPVPKGSFFDVTYPFEFTPDLAR